MNCPKCNWATHRATVTSQALPDQIVRKRTCCGCHYIWFTVEIVVPYYAVGWSPRHKCKPFLRAPVTVTTSLIEAQDGLAIAREKREQEYIDKLEKDLKPINN